VARRRSQIPRKLSNSRSSVTLQWFVHPNGKAYLPGAIFPTSTSGYEFVNSTRKSRNCNRVQALLRRIIHVVGQQDRLHSGSVVGSFSVLFYDRRVPMEDPPGQLRRETVALPSPTTDHPETSFQQTLVFKNIALQRVSIAHLLLAAF